MKRAYIFVVLLVVSSLAVGVVAGILIEKKLTSNYIRQVVRTKLQIGKERFFTPGFVKGQRDRRELFKKKFKMKVLERLDSELSLSEEQRKEIEQIFGDTEKEIKSLSKEMKSKFIEVRKKSNDKILNVLTPEQQEKFEHLIAEMDRKGQLKPERGTLQNKKF